MTKPPSPVITELNTLIEQSGTQAAVAERLQISQSYLSDILKGKRGLSSALLQKLGFVEIVVHVREKDAPAAMKAIEKAVR